MFCYLCIGTAAETTFHNFDLGKTTAGINTLGIPQRWPVGLIARERRVTTSTHP